MDISVIYPLHVTFNNSYIFERIQWCLSNTYNHLPNAEHVIVLSGNSLLKNKAIKLLKPYKGLIILSDYKATSPYSPGTARNHGVAHCSRDNLLFWDIDLLGSEELFNDIKKDIGDTSRPSNAFNMYPCLYLTQEYSKRIKKGLNNSAGSIYNTQTLLSQAYQAATTLQVNSIEHFAMATSTVFCSKNHFDRIGCFNESFIGHMGEDLELLNRLALMCQNYKVENDHNENHPSKIAAELKGFRRHFLNYSAPHLRNEAFTIHLHHSTQLGSIYKKNNAANTLLLVSEVSNELEKISIDDGGKKPVAEYGLLNELPSYLSLKPNIRRSHIERTRRKIRKLIVNPIAFFKDIN